MTKEAIEGYRSDVECAAKILTFLSIEATETVRSYKESVELNKQVILGQMTGVGHTPYYAAANLVLERYINPLKEKNNGR